MSDESKIKQTETEPESPAGVPDGTIEKTSDNVPEVLRDRIEHEEVVVNEYDDDGNVVGWHKEPAKEGSK